MTDEDTVIRASKVMSSSSPTCVRRDAKGYKPIYVTTLTGSKAVDLMTQLRPHMSARRQQQIDIAVASFSHTKKLVSEEDKIKIREMYAAGDLSQGEIGKIFSLCRETINRIINTVDIV